MGNEVSDDLKAKVRKAIEDESGSEKVVATAVSGGSQRAKRRYRTEVGLFVRQLGVLFDGGLPLHQAVDLIAKRTTSKHLGPYLSRISDDVSKGTPLWKSMQGFPDAFDRLSVSMVKAGEESGEASKTLDLLAESLEFGDELERKVINVMLFPMISILVALTVMLFLLVVIFPSMAERFAAADAELPAISSFIWGIGVNVQNYWYIYVVLLGGLIGAMIWFVTSKAYLIEFLKLRIPIIGKIFAMAAVARFAKTFAILLRAGFTTVDALDLAKAAVNNETIAEAIDEMKHAASEGSSMASPLTRHWYIPEMTADIVAIGEETGSLDHLLEHLAKLFELRVKDGSDRLVTILEPVMTLVVASLVLTVALAMFMPYFALFSQGIGL